ncbi:metallophosphoesterase family protein [Peribacillus sp. SCS-37]|uniref:metallophosphoesterase family protein n=1 Tax=Paraperibacillus esterisolvens TaxID=3115296 RepID=UPI003906AD18
MKIVVLSDTHMPRKGRSLPVQLKADLENCDLIIHGGDWQTLDVYKELSLYGEVKGVYGNVDGEDIKKLFPEKIIVESGHVRIGVTHGHGKGLTTERRARAAFEDEEVQAVIFGHSHIPLLKKEGGILIFNPGSPTDKRRQPRYSFGILTIEGGSVSARHVFFDKPVYEE